MVLWSVLTIRLVHGGTQGTDRQLRRNLWVIKLRFLDGVRDAMQVKSTPWRFISFGISFMYHGPQNLLRCGLMGPLAQVDLLEG